MSDEWQERKKPARLEKRYSFQDYNTLRDFLERAAELSERDNLYPDMGFGKDYANFTIYAEEGHEKLNDTQHLFAQNLDKLLEVQED